MEKSVMLTQGELMVPCKISAPEEIAYKNGWISREKLLESAERYGKSPYGLHLRAVAEGKVRY